MSVNLQSGFRKLKFAQKPVKLQSQIGFMCFRTKYCLSVVVWLEVGLSSGIFKVKSLNMPRILHNVERNAAGLIKKYL